MAAGGQEFREERREFAGEDGFDGGEGDVAAEFGAEGGDGAVGGGDAAGDDAAEVGEIGRDVEGEAVVGDPAFDGHAEGGEAGAHLKQVPMRIAASTPCSLKSSVTYIDSEGRPMPVPWTDIRSPR